MVAVALAGFMLPVTAMGQISLSDLGWSEPNVGFWDANERTGTLTTDVSERIVIVSGNITLDGAGHTITGPGTDGGIDGIYANQKTNITIRNVNIRGFNRGIFLRQTSDSTLMANTILYSFDGIGIYLYASPRNALTENTISSHNYGIYLDTSAGSTLTGNTVSGGSNGIHLHYSDRSTLMGNISSGGIRGIFLDYSGDSTLAENTVSSGKYGIHLHYSPIPTGQPSAGNTLTGNIISGVNHGTYIDYSWHNTLTGNTISDSVTGIYVHYSESNQIYNNNFINNEDQAYIGSFSQNNVFTLQAPTGGNYWNDWTTPDADSDGFVDNPYPIPGRNPGGEDTLPLVNKVPSTANQAPVAVAGDNQAIRADDLVKLNGSSSFDDNTKIRGRCSWYLCGGAGGHRRGWTRSEPDRVEISSDNLVPTAVAGDYQLVIIDTAVVLNGSGSSDPETDVLTFDWTITGAPTGSLATISDPDMEMAGLTPDLEGVYEVTLTVSDFLGAGAPDSVEITATSAESFAEIQIVSTDDIVAVLPPDQITTRSRTS